MGVRKGGRKRREGVERVKEKVSENYVSKLCRSRMVGRAREH